MLDRCGMKKILLTIIVLVVVLVSWMLLKNKEDVMVNTSTTTVSPTPDSTPSTGSVQASLPQVTPTSVVSPVVSKNIITYTDSGYTPNPITIKKGEAVIWKNESSNPMWTASAMHPTHKVYPGTDISACGTQTLMPMFDACAGVASGQSWSFTFNNVGTWGYHNHLNSSKFGKVVVVE